MHASSMGPCATSWRWPHVLDHVGRYWSCCDATQQDDLPLPVQHLYPTTPINALGTTDRTLERLGPDRTLVRHWIEDPGEAAEIEEIEDSIPDEEAMDLSRVPSPDGMDDAEIEAAIEEASFPEVYNTDAQVRDALFGDARPPGITNNGEVMAMVEEVIEDPDQPFYNAAEVAQLQRIVRDYETAEEQIAMEGLLMGYTDE